MKRKINGFSITEVLIVMTFMGVLLAMSMPLFTAKKQIQGYDTSSIACIKSELAANPGLDISASACASNPNSPCCRAVRYCQYDQNNACNTLAYYADKGADIQEQTNARKVLAASCDQDGKQACNYFAKECKDDSTSCDVASNDYDLFYYLNLPLSSSNLGKFNIVDIVKPYYDYGFANITAKVDSTCTAHPLSTACYINGTVGGGGGAGGGEDPPPASSGIAMCWGSGASGELGTGNTTGQTSPVQVSGNHTWSFISSGGNHNLAIDTDGNGWYWGYHFFGVMYDFYCPGCAPNQLEPVAISGNKTWSSLYTSFHACGIENVTGKGYCWGDNSYGQSGIGNTANQTGPIVEISGNKTWSQITNGYLLSCGLDNAGKAWCWGAGTYGALGTGNTNNQNSPTNVTGSIVFSNISTYDQHTCGIENVTNKAWCWGRGNWGQLGVGNNANLSYPVAVNSTNTWSSITVGTSHTCGIDTDGNAWCWGIATQGALGTGNTSNQTVPKVVSGSKKWSAISAAGFYTCGIDTSGKAWCWGQGTSGQLGTGNTSNQTVPTEVLGNYTWSSISAGGTHTCGILAQ